VPMPLSIRTQYRLICYKYAYIRRVRFGSYCLVEYRDTVDGAGVRIAGCLCKSDILCFRRVNSSILAFREGTSHFPKIQIKSIVF